jgi:putative restriction endonuclease
MKSGQRLWTRDELLLAINLYCKLPFGRLHARNPDIIHLAQLIDRTPSSVALKLCNFASLDPSLQARGIKGAANASKLDEAIWKEFYQHWDSLPYESETLLARIEDVPVEMLNSIPEQELPQEGKERERLVKVRVNQHFFRKTIMAAYNNTCCITGLRQPEMLIAGHIRPWGIDTANRMNPQNGIAINALHDRAFELGYLTITPDYKIRISSTFLQKKDAQTIAYFNQYEGVNMQLPQRFLPDPQFLKYHNEERFQP